MAPAVEQTAVMNGNEMLASISNAIQSENGIRYGGVDEAGTLDPSAKQREIAPEELEQMQNTNEWEQGLW